MTAPELDDARRATLEEVIRAALFSACAEKESNTPDHILAVKTR